MHTTDHPLRRNASRRRGAAAGAATICLMLAACGGSDATSSPHAATDAPITDGADSIDIGSDTDVDLSDLDLDTSGLDEGQLEILEDALDTGFDDDGPAPWLGVQLVDARSVETFTEAFPEEVAFPDVDALSFSDTHQAGFNTAIVGDAVWVATQNTLHRFVLADGSESATTDLGEIFPDDDQAAFIAIDGDETGVFAVVKGFDAGVIVEIDPVSGAVVGTWDVNVRGLRPVQLDAGPTHVASTVNGSSPVKVLDRATGIVSDVGNTETIKSVAVGTDRLIISNASGRVSEPYTYDVHALADGALLSSGELPFTTPIRAFGNRFLQGDASQDGQVVEIDPQGAPITDLLPADMVTVVDLVETDGLVYVITTCCVSDEFGTGLDFVAIDASTGQIVGGEPERGSHIVLPG